MKNIILVGAGDAGQKVYEFINEYTLFNVKAFAVDKEYVNSPTYLSVPLISIDEIDQCINKEEDYVFITLGWNKLNSERRDMYKKIRDKNYNFANLIAPSATISNSVTIGKNVWITERVIVGQGAEIGDFTILDPGCTIAHDSSVGAFCFAGIHSTVGGCSEIGAQTFIGLGAIIFDKTKIGECCLIGGGVVVKRDVEPYHIIKVQTTDQIVISSTKEEIINKLDGRKNVR